MSRRKPSSTSNEDLVFGCFGVLLVLAVLSLMVWALGSGRAENQSCEDNGGHVYSRTIGKLTYKKCVTDDNQVLEL